jgi:hypothetical protein
MNWKNKNYIFIILLILFIFGILFFGIFDSYFESFDNNTKIWALSFGGGEQNYRDAVFRMENELKETKVFDEIVIVTDIELKKDAEFWEKHGEFVENNKRGYGYWLWKPYLIKKTMEKMSDNDILMYIDSGCEIKIHENIYNKIMDYINKCDQYELLYSSTYQTEKRWNKSDNFVLLNLNNPDILNSDQKQATIFIIKKNQKMVDFIDDWYSICSNYNTIDDTPSTVPNDESFLDHRHDQAIFSLLIKSRKYHNINTDNNIFIEDENVIKLSRRRSG